MVGFPERKWKYTTSLSVGHLNHLPTYQGLQRGCFAKPMDWRLFVTIVTRENTMAASKDENTGMLFLNPDHKDKQDEVYASGKLFVGEEHHELEAWMVKDVKRGDVLELRAKHKKSSRASGDGDGELLRTDKTGKKDAFPDWKGMFTMKDGRTYEVAGWRRQSARTGSWFLSLKITQKEQKQEDKTEEQPFL